MGEGFDVNFGKKIIDPEQKKQSGPWERVTEEALKLISNEEKAKAIELINDLQFKSEVKGMWDRWTVEGRVNEDPAKQEEIWAKDLAEKIKSRISL